MFCSPDIGTLCILYMLWNIEAVQFVMQQFRPAMVILATAGDEMDCSIQHMLQHVC